MSWIADVVPQAKIRSSWGNAVRDHVLQTFATVAERNANAVPRTNMMAWTAAEKTLWLYDGTGWAIFEEPWQNWAGRIIAGRVAWAVGNPGGGLNQRLSPQSQLQYRRHMDTIEINVNVVFQDAYPVAEAPAAMALELPVNYAGTMDRLIGGAGAAYSNNLPGWMHGASTIQGGNAVVLSGASGLVAHNTAPAFPVAADTFGVRLSYPITVVYG